MAKKAPNPEKIQQEIARWEREKAKPKSRNYLLYFILIIAIVYIADEITSQIGTQMQSVVALELFAPILGGADFAAARMSLVNTIAGCSIGIAMIYKTLADRFGRKPFLVINTLGMGVGLLLIGAATNIPMYAVGAFVSSLFPTICSRCTFTKVPPLKSAQRFTPSSRQSLPWP